MAMRAARGAGTGAGGCEGKAKAVPVVERVALFRVPPGAPEGAAEAMLDSLWSLQYQVRGVMCATAGEAVEADRPFTHALHMRFPNAQAMEAFQADPQVAGCYASEVEPLCEDFMAVAFEGAVEDDIFPLFQRGDDWDFGYDHFVLLQGSEGLEEVAAERVAAFLASDAGPWVQRLTHGVYENDEFDPDLVVYCLLMRCQTEAQLNVLKDHPAFKGIVEANPVTNKIDLSFGVAPPLGQKNMGD